MTKAAAQPTTKNACHSSCSEAHLRRLAGLLARLAAAQLARQERGG
jgi:hypothetical protein